jgi:hypothetical protein
MAINMIQLSAGLKISAMKNQNSPPRPILDAYKRIASDIHIQQNMNMKNTLSLMNNPLCWFIYSQVPRFLARARIPWRSLS